LVHAVDATEHLRSAPAERAAFGGEVVGSPASERRARSQDLFDTMLIEPANLEHSHSAAAIVSKKSALDV
jgi:hypothetical protein